MKITPTTLNLSQLFSSANEKFVIPACQRRYSWQEKQLTELFEDINNLRSDDSHLLGSLICLTASHTAGINPLELVDGQQRITTLSIFLKALQDKYEEVGNEETGELNIVASNNPFESKLKEYQKSNIRLTTALYTEYTDMRFDFDAVEERCERFAKIAVGLWKFS